MFRIQEEEYGSEGLQLKVEFAGSVVPHSRMWFPMPGHTLSMSHVHLLTTPFFSLTLFQFWLCWVFIAVHGLPLVAVNGGYSLSWRSGFSLWWLLLLQSAGSVAMVHGLSCSILDLPEPGIKPVSPALAGGFLTTFPGKSYSLFLGETSN